MVKVALDRMTYRKVLTNPPPTNTQKLLANVMGNKKTLIKGKQVLEPLNLVVPLGH